MRLVYMCLRYLVWVMRPPDSITGPARHDMCDMRHELLYRLDQKIGDGRDTF